MTTESTQTSNAGDERGVRRSITGTVTSTKMDKTAVITVIRRVRDRRFHKFVTRRMKYKAHDEHNKARVGDVVELVEARPMSATKRWRIVRTISHSAEVPADRNERREGGEETEA
jgi:small subunit ribosomal protein S17